jgi:hypothetical protein
MLLADGPVQRAELPTERAVNIDDFSQDKLRLTTIASFKVPVGGQDIELQQVDYAHGGISLLRLRIREGKRFTIFDIDPVTARHWGELLQRWGEAQGAGGQD